MMPILLAVVSLVAPPLVTHTFEPVRLTVSSAAVPKPAMKYQLLPEVRELKAGNPVQWYLRCFAEQRNFFFNKDAVAERARFRTMPLKELPPEKLLNYGGNALSQADWAARLNAPDWQALDRVQAEGTDLVFPELTAFRELAAGLQARFRGEIARRDFTAAIGTAKTMFGFARHLGEHPTTAANSLGLAVASMALDTLEEMLQQPDCPNLYWALTGLPTPVVDLRKGFQGACVLVDNELRAIRDDAPLPDADLNELVGRISGREGIAREQTGQPPRNLRAKFGALAKGEDGVRAARHRLVDAGCAESLVARFPAMQVVLLDAKREFEARRDEEMKLLLLSPMEIDALPRNEKKPDTDALFAEFLPRVVEGRRLQARLEQRIALFRHVEALRMFAAGHADKFPEKLADVGVPLPSDPFTGKAFEYTLEGSIAHLRSDPPKGDESHAALRVNYEIAIRQRAER
jgi:hypothetical protein